MHPRRPASIARRIHRAFLLLIVCVLGVSTAYSVITGLQTLREEVDNIISDCAYLLAQDEKVLAMLERGSPDELTTTFLDDVLISVDRIDMLVVADTNSVRLYHPEKFRVGEAYSGSDQHDILAGAPPYITEAFGTKEHQRRAYHAVYGEAGEIIGFVMASTYTAHIWDMQSTILLESAAFFLLALLVGGVLAALLSRSIKKSLLGYEPERIAELYLQNEEILDSLEEGIIALDHDSKDAYANAAARRMLARSFPGDPPAMAEAFVRHLHAGAPLTRAIQGRELAVSGGAILVDALPVKGDDQQGGVVYILRDKAEQRRLAEQLTGVNHIVAALRASSHEHLNKLHVVLGLLKMQDVETAVRYIEQARGEEEEDYSFVIRCIENKTIAALILGKKRRAKERNMRLWLRRDSRLGSPHEHLTSDELITAIGNLLENAMDAVEQCDGPREIALYLHGDEGGLVIGVDDTGVGISPEDIARIHAGGFTTRGEGHGIGLRLVGEIVRKYRGTMDIESEPGEGTSFTLTFYTDPQ